MESSDELKIVCIAPELIGAMWPHVGGHLLKGQITVTKGNVGEALVALTHLVLDAQEGKCQLWAVIDDADKLVIAAMVSEILVEDGRKLVWVKGMGGEQINLWGKPISDAMAEFAKAEGCEAVRFAGRKGLGRAYRDVRIVGEHDEGVHLFERAV